MAVIGYFEIIVERFSISVVWNKISKLVLVLVFISMIKNPIDELLYSFKVYDGPRNEVIHAKILADAGFLRGKKIATFYDSKSLYDFLSLACFQGGGKYYGEVWTDKPWPEQLAEIKQFQLDFVAVRDCDLEKNDCDEKSWLGTYPVIYKDKILKVKIYKLR